MIVTETRALPVWRVWLNRAADLVGFALLIFLLRQIFFARGPSFDGIASAVGVAGLAAAWAKRELPRVTWHRLLAAYVALTVLSTVVHRLQIWPALFGSTPVAPWRPAIHTLILVLFFYGVASLLATSWRIQILLAVMVVAASVLAVPVLYDHAVFGLATRPLEYPSANQWTGYADLALVFALVFPLPLAAAVASRSRGFLAASALLALAFAFDVALLFSRVAYITVAVTYVVLSVVEWTRLKGARLAAVALLAVAIAAAVAAPRARAVQEIWSGRSFGVYEQSKYTSRIIIWSRVSELVRDYPWLGVGPGNYHHVMQEKYMKYFDPYVYADHAHNMFLHIAAESGIPAAVAFLLIWYHVLKRLVAACARDSIGVLALAVLGALAAFFFRCLSDHFMSRFLTADRVSLLLWTFFAAAVAIARMRDDLAPPFPSRAVV